MARKKPPQNAAQVLGTMRRLGFDEPFSMGVVCLLDTDFVADRLLRFLRNARPASREVVADELLAIIGDRDKYVQKHVDDYYRRVNTVEGLFLRGFDIDWASPGAAESYIASIPALRATESFTFRKNITFFVGENGSGKSTLLEAVAVALGLNPEGGTRNYRFSTYDDVSPLCRALHLRRGPSRPEWSYFLRAESFFNMATATQTMYNDDGRLPDYHARSHGESFLDYVQKNDGLGLYLMDEPEAALSPQRQLTLLLHLYRMARSGSQFLIVTHSPILLGVPDADIFSLDDGQIRPIPYEETDSYMITKMFLDDRKRVLHSLLSDDEEP